MPSTTDLRGLQSLFWKLVTAPEGVESGARALAEAGELASPDLTFLVPDDSRLRASERLDIYADMYFYRLLDCLQEDFPRLAAHLASAHFHNLVTDYLLAHPPRHPSLRELGRALPDFVATHELADRHPAAVDLARLEWARIEVFDAADAPPLSLDALLEGAAREPDDFRVARIPGARILELAPAALGLWREDAPAHASAGGPRLGVRVWRKDFAVYHCSMDTDETAALSRLSTGPALLAELAELVVERGPAGRDPAESSQRFAALLAAWTRDELLTASPATAMR